MSISKIKINNVEHDIIAIDLNENCALITDEDIIAITGNANIETWSFTLEDGTTVNKDVVVS